MTNLDRMLALQVLERLGSSVPADVRAVLTSDDIEFEVAASGRNGQVFRRPSTLQVLRVHNHNADLSSVSRFSQVNALSRQKPAREPSVPRVPDAD